MAMAPLCAVALMISVAGATLEAACPSAACGSTVEEAAMLQVGSGRLGRSVEELHFHSLHLEPNAQTYEETHMFQGRVSDTLNGKPLEKCMVSIVGQDEPTAETDDLGIFKMKLPPGEYLLNVNKNYYNEMNGVFKLDNTLIGSNGYLDVKLKPQLLSDEWKFVLSWGRNPNLVAKDLDSYTYVGDPEKDCKLFYATGLGHKSEDICVWANGIEGTLDRDDQNFIGKETVHLKNVKGQKEKIVYKIKNFSRSPTLLLSKAKVTVINGFQEVITFDLTKGDGFVDGPEGVWWSVFSIDPVTKEITMCKTEKC